MAVKNLNFFRNCERVRRGVVPWSGPQVYKKESKLVRLYFPPTSPSAGLSCLLIGQFC